VYVISDTVIDGPQKSSVLLPTVRVITPPFFKVDDNF